MSEREAAEAAVLDAMAFFMRVGGDGEELVEMAQRESEWWEDERRAGRGANTA